MSNVCPYLGHCDDPASYYAFPTDGNCCHAGQRPLPVAPSYQSTTCLAEGWAACPRYQAATDQAPLGAPTGPPVGKRLPRLSRPPWIVAIALAVAGLLLAVWFLVLRPGSTGDGPLPATPTVTVLQGQTPTQTVPTATVALELTPVQDTPSATELAARQSSTAPASTAPSTATPGTTPSFTPRPAPIRSPTSTSSPTSTRAATPTLGRTPTDTPSLSPTWTVTATASGTPTGTLSPTPELTATSALPPAPTLVAPADRQDFSGESRIVLTWRSADGLPPGAYYAITVAYSHLGATWYDEVPWTQDTSWTLSDHAYLLDLSDDGQFRWSVQVVRQTSVDDSGKPAGEPLSPPSEVRTVIWRRATGDTERAGPQATPQPPAP